MNVHETLRKACDAHVKGQIDEAENLYRKVLKKKPDEITALHHLGVIHLDRGQFDIAAELIGKSIARDKKSPEAYSNLGLVLAAQGKLEEAAAAHRRAIALDPNNPVSCCNYANLLIDQGNLGEAIQYFHKAVSLKPDYAAGYYNLGVALQQQKKSGEAAQAFENCIRFAPRMAEAYCNLGCSRMELREREKAVAAYKTAIAIKANFPEAYNNLGRSLVELGRNEEAINAFRQAVALQPGYAVAQLNLIIALRKHGQLSDAVEACRGALAAVPAHIATRIESINLKQHACDWSSYDSDMQQMLNLDSVVEPFVLLSTPSSAAQQLVCAQTFSSQIPRNVAFAHNRTKRSDRIRVGYLSCDFHLHATAFLMAELFERHDRSRFEICAYAYDRDDGSDIRQRLVKGFDRFVDLYSTFDGDAAKRIYEDEVDILVDLKGYTGNARMNILVDRPAPIQVNYVGYPGTMGADYIDYIIADPIVTPKEHQPFYAEKIVQLPHCYQPNDTKRQILDQTPSRRDCGLPEQGFVFCCFNGSFKITPVFFDIWMRLLGAVPQSVLWLLSKDPVVESNLRREAQGRGVDPHRLIFADLTAPAIHLARQRLADLFLDTLPVGAHTTASDALWAGLPVLTCTGETFAGRVGSSTLQAVGLPELITTSIGEYEARALELASRPAELSALRQRLAQNLATAPLFDIARYTRGLEAAYTRMWELWRAGAEPQAFAIGDEFQHHNI
ncbi:MAG: tetratricopeptide repeat protein [Rhizomicrobium sp.]